MGSILSEVRFILTLIAANGLFAMAELAVVSARKSRLKDRADRGDHKARSAFDLASDPNRFPSTVQVGITRVGTQGSSAGRRSPRTSRLASRKSPRSPPMPRASA